MDTHTANGGVEWGGEGVCVCRWGVRVRLSRVGT